MTDVDEKIVKNMIAYVEEEEKEIQAAKLGPKAKSKAVANIIKELERQIKYADKEC